MAEISYVTLSHASQMRLIMIFVLPLTRAENLAHGACIIYLVLAYGIMQESSNRSSCNKSIKYP